MVTTTATLRNNSDVQHNDRSTSTSMMITAVAVSAVSSFLFGSILSYVYVSSSRRFLKYSSRSNDDDDNNDATKTYIDSNNNDNPVLYDTPELDLRLIRKAEAVIQKRTDKVIIVIERCTNDHNYSAILRTAEALGIQTICLIDPPIPTTINEVDGTIIHQQCDESNENENGEAPYKPKTIKLSDTERKVFSDHRKFAQNATEWLTIREFTTAMDCITTLRDNEGYAIWVTDLSQVAVPLTKHDLYHNHCYPLPDKIAIVMGTEAVGCSVEMLDNANVRCYLPLYGFADSLNLSVATALVIQQIFHLHPNYIGNMSFENRCKLRQLWFPKLAQQRLLSARQKKQHRAIQKQIETCQRLQVRYESGDILTEEQIIKMNAIIQHEQKLHDIEMNGQYHMASNIVQDLIDHPPQPLSDLRRADIHRVTFVGKNVKKKHEHHWKDMVAISKQPLPKLTTALFFRNRLLSEKTKQQ